MSEALQFRLVVRPRFMRSPIVVAQVKTLYNNADPRDPFDLGQTCLHWRDATPEDIATHFGGQQ